MELTQLDFSTKPEYQITNIPEPTGDLALRTLKLSNQQITDGGPHYLIQENLFQGLWKRGVI